ncbi:MAG TPA: PIN domain-containing protein [Candidatus Acidoferrales bacterium]|nr:PIN domain-containing protein [Candidatus Acidoferrales bacterium]
MKVLVDANVIFDVYERRRPHYSASQQICRLAQRRTLAAAIAGHTIANGFYIYRKPFAAFVHERILEDFEICCADAHHTRSCLNLGIVDFEDALQAGAAMGWKAAFIITRNERDFRRSAVPALSPSAFLKRFH